MVSTRTLTRLALLLLLTVWAYRDVASAAFVYEDRNPMVSYDLTESESALRGPWTTWQDERGYFNIAPRMWSNLTMRMQGWVGATARGYHLGNLAIHLLNGALFFALMTPLGDAVALCGSLWFLLHPINREAVSYVSARPDLLYGTAVLAMLWCAQREHWQNIVAVAGCGALAVLAKESAVIVIGLLPIWLIYTREWTPQRAPRWLVPLAAWTVAGLCVVYRLVHVSAHEGSAHPWGAIWAYTSGAAFGTIGYAAMQAAALWRLLALIIWPFGFSIDHDFDVIPLALGALAFVGLCALVIAAWMIRRVAPIGAFAVAWLLGSLVIRFLFPMPEYLHEQHLYVPLIGLWMALGVGLVRLTDVIADGRWLLTFTRLGELHHGAQ